MTSSTDSAASMSFAADLLQWYASYKRSLPWRVNQDNAYAVWISEIMLQQTTVNAVIGFYNRWMERFPTLTSLADAPLDDVLKHWAGLGYYARARNLKKAAEEVVRRFDGVLPISVDQLMTLPGIGRYTAGAISSIAFGLEAPIVDANVIRVLCRLFALHGDPKTSSVLQKQLWHIAESSIPTGKARDYNQALMELGALVCQPSAPQCIRCPISRHCEAKRTGDPTVFPEFGVTKKWIEVTHVSCFVELDNRLLIVQRPLEKLWGGLWELPRVAVLSDEPVDLAAKRAVFETVGLIVDCVRPFGSIRHVVTNRKVSLHGCDATWSGEGEPKALACRQFAWVDAAELERYAISSPQLELLAHWRKTRLQPGLQY